MTNRIKKNIEQLIDQRAPEWFDEQLVRLGNMAGTVLTGTPGRLYARQNNGKVIRVHNGNANVPPVFDLHVRIGRKKSMPNIWQIISVQEDYDEPVTRGQLPYHHEQHEEAGADRLNLNWKQVVARSVRVKTAASFIVRLFGDPDLTVNGWVPILTQDLDLSSYVPASGALFVSIESDEDGAVTVHAGTGFAAPNVGTTADYPVPDAGKYTLAHVLLFESQTELLDEQIIIPKPPSFNPLDYSSGAHTHALDDLIDVDAPSPTDLYVLTYDAYAEEWVPEDRGVANGDAHDHSGGDGGQVGHSTLGGLQGGTSGEYYHLTSAQHTKLTAAKGAFSAYNSATDSDVTGDNTAYTIVFDTEISDPDSAYNNSTGQFTAPVNGLYLFAANALFRQVSPGTHTELDLNVVIAGTSAATYTFARVDLPAGFSDFILNSTVLAYMTAGDTAEVQAVAFGSSKVVDIFGTASPYTRFAGVFVG